MKKLMIAEDDPDLRTILVRLAKNRGYDVCECKDGFDALKCLLKSDGHIDVLITDLEMPRINGDELIRMAQTLKVDIGQIILISGSTLPTSDLSSLISKDSPFSLHFIRKPLDPDQLFNSIENGTSKSI